MSGNVKIIGVVIIALAIGFGAGYFVFGKSGKGMEIMDNHVHDHGAMTAENGEAIWTCSMHPQIRQNESGDCPICGMDLIPLENKANDDPLVLEMTESATKLADIQTTVVGVSEASGGKLVRLSGKVQADERRASSQVAHVPGRIEKLFVSFTGEQVSEGQKLATIYSPELITAQRELLEAVKLQTINPGLVEAARNKLRFWKIDDATIAAIEQAKKVRETFPLFATASGIVTNRRVAVGDYLKQGEPLFDLMNLGKVWVLFDAYETDLPHIAVGDYIEFSTPSIPNKKFKTRITFIDPVINPQSRVAALRTEVNNKRSLLKPAMFVQGLLQNKTTATTQLRVPKSAVLWTGTRSVVYVKVPNTEIPSYQFREVELGENQGTHYAVFSGLEAGEEVVTNGSFTIDAAAQLNNQASMMNKQVKVKKVKQAANLNMPREAQPAFKTQLTLVAQAYLTLKDALVASEATQAATAGQAFLSDLEQVDMTLVKGEAHRFWMENLAGLKAHGKKVSESSDLEEQRQQFYFLSQTLIATLQSFGVDQDTFYVQYCPMANDNQGATWLSKEKEILNPYFGDAMLHCGSVQSEISSGSTNF